MDLNWDERTTRVAVVEEGEHGGRLRPLGEDGVPVGVEVVVGDLGVAVAEVEGRYRPRWVWAAAEPLYPRLLELLALPGGLSRCHDAALVEAVLLGHEGHWGEPRSLGAAHARLHGLPVPADLPGAAADDRPTLFEADRRQLPSGADPLTALVEVHAEQLRRIERAEHPGRMRLLCAAESAGALAAAEMTRHGLPWSAAEHDRLLTALLGPRPSGGLAPKVLAELAEEIRRAFGGRPVNPDSPAQVLKAFGEAGIRIGSTRQHVLEELEHPAAELLLRYKELARIHSGHGWAWRETWARGGRLRPGYVVGGVVSGRWATRGGAALQIPRSLRSAVAADPGRRLVVADAGQLEPRVLAAMSGDPGLARAAAAGDLYLALARQSFGGDRDRAKIGLLAAMYGQTGGEAGQLAVQLRHRYPAAMALVDGAARVGEEGGSVRSALGRTSPRGADAELPDGAPDRDLDEPGAGQRPDRAARSRGRFTRNFVIQASAADWALVLIAALRRRLAELADGQARLVFFQHDEVVVDTPQELAEEVLAAVAEAGREAGALVFGDTPVRFPLEARAVSDYTDAKG